MKLLDAAAEWCEKQQSKDWLNAWAFLDSETGRVRKQCTHICMAGMNYSFHKVQQPAAFVLLYNGIHPKAKELQRHPLHDTPRVYNEETKQWLELLVGKESPYKELLPGLHNDPRYINKYGFVWKDAEGLPIKMLYNFGIAQRRSYEFPWKHYAFLRWLDKGLPVREASYLSSVWHERGELAAWSPGGHEHLENSGDAIRFYHRYVNLGKADVKKSELTQLGEVHETDESAEIWSRKRGSGWMDLSGRARDRSSVPEFTRELARKYEEK